MVFDWLSSSVGHHVYQMVSRPHWDAPEPELMLVYVHVSVCSRSVARVHLATPLVRISLCAVRMQLCKRVCTLCMHACTPLQIFLTCASLLLCVCVCVCVCVQIFLTCGFNRWTHASPVGPLPMLPPDVLPTFDDKGNELTPYLMRSGSPTHWRVSEAHAHTHTHTHAHADAYLLACSTLFLMRSGSLIYKGIHGCVAFTVALIVVMQSQ